MGIGADMLDMSMEQFEQNNDGDENMLTAAHQVDNDRTDFSLVSVLLGNQPYTYKLHESIKLSPDDYVLVQTPYGLKVAEWTSIEDKSTQDLNVPYNYKWVIDKVDFVRYHKIVSNERDRIKKEETKRNEIIKRKMQ